MLEVCAFILCASTSWAYEARLIAPDGSPLQNAQVSVAGRGVNVRTDARGHFALRPEPRFPITLIVISSSGELYPPLYVDAPRRTELRVEDSYRESITVSSGAAPNTETSAASVATIIGREEIEERKPPHLVDAVASIPGVSVRGEGPSAVPVIRGLSSGRTLLMLDDTRVVTERRAGPSATFLDPFSLATIEVARGPGSVAYGSDALGGIIHARSRDPEPGRATTRYQLFAAAGAEDAVGAAAETSFALAGGMLLAAAHGRSANDATDGGGTPTQNSAYSDHGAALRFVKSYGASRLRLTLASDRARDVGAPAADANTTRTFYPIEHSDRFTASFETTNGIELRAAMSRHRLVTTRERLPGGSRSSSDVRANDASLRAAITRLGARSRTHGGLDFVSRFDLRADTSIIDAHKHDLGIFVVRDDLLLPRLSLSTGIRADRIETRNRNGSAGNHARRDLAWSGHAGVTAGPWRDVTASLQIASGYREPSLSDRYFRGVTGRGFVTGNPDLEPERSRQIDARLRWQRPSGALVIAAYDYEIEDLVERFRHGSDFFFRNRGSATIRGIELEGEVRPRRWLTLRAGAAHARGEADSGVPIDDISPSNLLVEIRNAGRRHSVFATGRFHARHDRPGPVETQRPAYRTIDFGAGYRLQEALELRILVQNVTNELRAGSNDANAANAPGRSIRLSLNGTFPHHRK